MRICFQSLAARLGGSFVLSFVIVGCGQSAIQGEVASPSQPAAVFAENGSGRYQSARFGFSLTLPEGASWRIEDGGRSPWLEATHEKTSSRLRIRASTERSALSREACLEASRGLGLPELEDASLVDDRVERLGDDEASVWIRAGIRTNEAQAIEGIVLASAVSLRRCLVFVYETTVDEGPHPEQVIAERLAVVVHSVLPSLHFTPPLALPQAER